MLALGGLLAGCALLAFSALVPIFQRADPPAWTNARLVGELVSIAIVSAAAIGLGLVGAGAITVAQQGPSLFDVAGLAVVVVAGVLLGRRLRARGRAIVAADAHAGKAAAGPADARLAAAGLAMATDDPDDSPPQRRAA